MATSSAIDEMPGGLVRSRDAARFLDYSERQLRRLVASGVLEPVQLAPGAHPRYRLRDLVALAESKKE